MVGTYIKLLLTCLHQYFEQGISDALTRFKASDMPLTPQGQRKKLHHCSLHQGIIVVKLKRHCEFGSTLPVVTNKCVCQNALVFPKAEHDDN